MLVPSPPVSGLPSPITQSCFYRCSPATGYSYLSVPQPDGGYLTYRWDASTAVATPLFDRKVDAALSTGRLLSRRGDDAFIYDASGKLLSRFPLGALDYVGEYWDSVEGRQRMVFVLPLIVGGENSDERELTFELYSWPTSEVTRLD